MAISPKFESDYILSFAGIVRHGGATPLVWSEWIRRISDELSKIENPKINGEARERINRISNFGSNLIEDSRNSRDSIADEIEKLADFVDQLSG
jgi:hypothetical protein